MKKKCLIVCDDNTDILEITTLVLENKGYHVIPLLNCDDYLKVISEVQPDLILMDIWMLKQSGDVITKLIKMNKKFNKIPIIICSANIDIEEVAKECGADGFIRKPWDISYIENMINRFAA